MKRQAGLFEPIVRFDNLLLAARQAARGKRDKPAVARFEFHREQELLALQEDLKPEEQGSQLAMQFGCARFVYNRALAMKRAAWKERQESMSCYSLILALPNWKAELPWLKDADSQVLQQSLRNLDRAFQNFFEKRARYPRPKKKHHEQSIQYPQRVKLDATRIYLPKVGWVDAKVHREIQGTIKTVTVRKTATGKYFASVLTEDGKASPEPIQHFEKVEALDLGLSRFATVSTGEVIDNPRFLKNASRNLRRKQKRLSRKTTGSANRNKARLLVAKAHERVANTRKWNAGVDGW